MKWNEFFQVSAFNRTFNLLRTNDFLQRSHVWAHAPTARTPSETFALSLGHLPPNYVRWSVLVILSHRSEIWNEMSIFRGVPSTVPLICFGQMIFSSVHMIELMLPLLIHQAKDLHCRLGIFHQTMFADLYWSFCHIEVKHEMSFSGECLQPYL